MSSSQQPIVTAHVKVKLYRFVEVPAKTLTRDDLHACLKTFEAKDPESPLSELKKKFPADLHLLYWGSPIDIFIEGAKVRNDIRGQGAREVVEEVHVFTGDQQLAYQRVNNQASVFAGHSGVHIIKEPDLRLSLPARLGDKPERYQIADDSADTVRVTWDQSHMVVEKSSAFIREYASWEAPGKGARRVIREAFQYRPVTYAGGIVFPTVHVSAKYEAGHIQLLNVYVIQDAEFNVELPDRIFTLSAPSKTQVVDYRNDRTKPMQRIAREDVQDVVQFADRPAAAGARTQGNFNGIAWLSVAALGLLLIVSGCRVFLGKQKAK